MSKRCSCCGEKKKYCYCYSSSSSGGSGGHKNKNAFQGLYMPGEKTIEKAEKKIAKLLGWP